MRKFFAALIPLLTIKTGVDMLIFIAEDQIDPLISELVAAGQVDPFHQISDEVKQRLIMENIITDGSFVNPPFGCKPGLNRRILTKWYRAHWEIHGNTIAKKNSTTTAEDDYARYVEWAQRNNLPVLPPGEASEEAVKHYVDEFAKNLEGLGKNQDEHRLHPIQARFGKSAAAEYAAKKQKFVIEGIEILADSKEQAIEIFAKQ